MIDADEAIVRRAISGDRAAFEELVRRTSRLVYARLYLDTRDPHKAEDLTQETFLSVFRSIGRLKDPRTFRTWLLTIAQRIFIDAVRREETKKRHATRQMHEKRETSPETHAQQHEEREKVLAILGSLPEEYRLPLTLRYIAGADYETIQTQMGLTNGSLRGLLHRGLKLLRDRMQESV